MVLISLIFALIVAVVAFIYVAEPLRTPSTTLRADEDDELVDLIQRKDAVMRSIKEVEFDYHTGKLSEEDYEAYDQRMRQQAIGLIRQIEKRSPEVAGLDAELEAMIASRRKTKPTAMTAVNGATPVPTSAAPATATPLPAEESDVIFCHECGAKAKTSDKFCAQCGTALRVETV